MKYNFEQERCDYLTPQNIINKVLEHLDIDKFSIDVCCSYKNIPAEKHFIDGKIDGLIENWSTEGWNWCNPPYKTCKDWVKKASREALKGCASVLFIPARTETDYFHKFILNKSNVEVEFLRKGTKFIHPETGEEMGVYKNALALVYFYPAED